MTPHTLAIAEQQAYAALQRHSDDRTHREWVSVCDDLLDFIRGSGPVEHHASNTRYSLNHYGKLRKTPLYRRRFLEWSLSGSVSCSSAS